MLAETPLDIRTEAVGGEVADAAGGYLHSVGASDCISYLISVGENVQCFIYTFA